MVLKIRKEWDSILDAYDKAPWEYGDKNQKLNRMLLELFQKNVSRSDLQNLLDTCPSLPIRRKDRTPSSMLFSHT